MRHLAHKICFTTALAFLLAMASCGDLVERSGNGKLDGYWKLKTIDTLSTGNQLDASQQLKFLAVQGKILMLDDRGAGLQFIFQFNHSNGTLTTYDARLSDRTKGDPLLQSTDSIAPFGFNSLEETFTVEQLTGGKLVLNDGTLRLHFIKF